MSLHPGSNLGSCNIGCLEPNAFNFTGASAVTAVDIQANTFAALPEALLSSMPALLSFNAQANAKLATLPNQFFSRQGQLQSMTFAASTNFGSTERLPDGLWRGLTNLTSITLLDCRYQNLPDMSDLTVCWARRGAACHAFGWLDMKSVTCVEHGLKFRGSSCKGAR